MLLQRIQQHFIDGADLQYQCAQTLGPAVEAATHAVLASVTSGGKVLGCGMGLGGALVQAFVAAFVGRFERDRPELAAVALGANAVVLSGLYSHFDNQSVYARQVRALGVPGDVLLLVTSTDPTPEILAAIDAAHGREMTVVALCGLRPGLMTHVLKDTDVLVAVPSDRAPRVQEVQQVVLHCICDGVDAQLLGEDPASEIGI